MRSTRARSVSLLPVLAVAAVAATAQGAPETGLLPADAILAEPFTRIRSIRELSDGRVLISDNAENRFVVADLRTGSIRPLGFNGAGPGEYRQAGALFALTLDSTLFMDAARMRRWLLLAGDTIVATLPPNHPAVGSVSGDVFGVDTLGHILSVRTLRAERLSGDLSRLQQVAILTSRRGLPPDTVVALRGFDQHVRETGTKAQPFMVVTVLLGSVAEPVQLFPDGWIAIVRLDPYRVEWRDPQNRLIRGPDLGWKAPRADAKEQRAYAQRVRSRLGSAVNASDMPWADRLAPVRSNPLLPTPEGHVLILRAQWSGENDDTRYDVVNRAGRLVRRIRLPDMERIVGFGARSVYVAVTDANGFQSLRRHPWPR